MKLSSTVAHGAMLMLALGSAAPVAAQARADSPAAKLIDRLLTGGPRWPRIGQAMNSHIVRILAQAAGWRLADMPADLGLPLAGCLYNEANHLLVTTTVGNLATAIAAIDSALVATRSDALIIRTPSADAMPGFALGLWHSGRVTWHWMLTLWVDVDAGLWLVPTLDKRDHTAASGFRLTARHLRVEEVPWRTAHERADGLVRAIRLLVHGERSPAPGPAGGEDRS